MQVLELTLPFISDCRTLAACTALSTDLQQLVQRRVQQHAAVLVADCACERSSRTALAALQWLCSMCGQDVIRRVDVGHALLKFSSTLPSWAAEELGYVLSEAGEGSTEPWHY